MLPDSWPDTSVGHRTGTTTMVAKKKQRKKNEGKKVLRPFQFSHMIFHAEFCYEILKGARRDEHGNLQKKKEGEKREERGQGNCSCQLENSLALDLNLFPEERCVRSDKGREKRPES